MLDKETKKTMKLVSDAAEMNAFERAAVYERGREKYEEKYNRLRMEKVRARVESLKGELMRAVDENNLIKVNKAVYRIAQEVSYRETSYYERGKNYSEAFIEASKKGYTKIASALLEAGADFDVQDEEGKTALMHAAENGYLEIAEELIVLGADASIADKQGRTPLDAAQKNGFKEIEKLIKGDKEVVKAADEKIRARESILKWQNPFGTRLEQDEIRRKIKAQERLSEEGWKVSTKHESALEVVFNKRDQELEYINKRVEKEGLQGLARLLIGGWARCRG